MFEILLIKSASSILVSWQRVGLDLMDFKPSLFIQGLKDRLKKQIAWLNPFLPRDIAELHLDPQKLVKLQPSLVPWPVNQRLNHIDQDHDITLILDK